MKNEVKKIKYVGYRFGREQGFTFAEVLVTMLILTVGLLALAGLFIAQIKGNAAGNELTVANVISQDLFERFAQMDTTDHVFTVGAHPDDTDIANGFTNQPVNVLGQTGQSTSKFTRGWTVTSLTTPPGALHVVVAISWTDKNSFPHVVTYRGMK